MCERRLRVASRHVWGCFVLLFACARVFACAPALNAQTRGAVVDQTGLPLPGVHIDVRRGDTIIASLDTGMDGGFTLPETQPSDVLDVSLDGFETAHVPPANVQRIVLTVAHATETTQVVASVLTSAGASMEHLGSTMTAPLAQRLPTSRPRILQSLPLLPAVYRGRDGLLRIGGTRPHESSLWIDGLDVTDPVSGVTNLDLPVEAVRGMAVLREPVAATFADILGSLASVETTPGGDQFKAGVQGFIPRPRLSHLGLGRIEAFFPRAYAGGRIGILRYFGSTEFNFERVPVPGVTGHSGRPNIGTTGVTSFGRVDLQPSTRHSVTFTGLAAPATTTSSGLSTLRPAETVPDIHVNDFFGGVTERLVITSRDLMVVRVGAIDHESTLGARGTGDAVLTPDGWQQNWFSRVGTSGKRVTMSVTWDRSAITALGAHSLSIAGRINHRSMTASLVDESIRITDEAGRLARLIEFGQAGALQASEWYEGTAIRDLWDVSDRIQIDLGARVDGGGSSDGAVLGPRFGARYLLDQSGRTTIRGSVGRYVGRVPLGAKAFGAFPARMDTTFDIPTGLPIRRLAYQPRGESLALPYADAVALEIEHRLVPTLELQAAVRERHGRHLPTVDVPEAGGPTLLAAIGRSTYREFQLSARKTWTGQSQLFVSYVRSSSTGELNDFGTLFTNLDAPLLEPGGRAPIPVDVPHRLRGWATFSLPRQIVLSPAVEWRTGFPYSSLNVYQNYAGPPNSQRFPNLFETDVTTFKTFDLLGRKMDLGLQFFNVTSHFNPQDVIAVVDSTRYQHFQSSFGITVSGYMQVRW